jgi:hypothetical protein
VLYNGQQQLQKFFMTVLGRDRMILGYPFLWEFNPRINWIDGKVEGGNVTLQSTKFKYLRQVFRRVGETLRKTGQLPQWIIVFLRHTNLAQEWNHLEEMNRTHMTMETIPKEFRRDWKVFLKELSKWFPPKCNPDMTIKFLPNAPSSIKCKLYLRSKVEGEIEEGWITREGIGMHRRRSVAICLPHLLYWQEGQWQEKGHYRLQESECLDHQGS